MMRTGFLLTILLGALVYTWGAFADLSFLSSTGRLGPGFFPRILGVMLVAMILYALLFERVKGQDDEAGHGGETYWRDVLIVMAMTGALVALLNVLGGIAAMAVFLVACLWTLNPRGHITNVAVSITIPLAIYLMFDVWLNASMPRSTLPFLG